MLSNLYRRLAFSAFLIFTLHSALCAQGILKDTSYGQQHDFTSVMGREFWFAPPALFGTGGQYYQLCLTSPKNTTVHIHVANIDATVNVLAGKTSTYSLPLTQVIKTSGIIENKGYHVWSDSADLDAMLVADYSADSAGGATHLLPDFRLGKDYAVASYEAFFIGLGNSQYDYPSMITIVAEHDNTLVAIVPSADLRQETETNPDPTSVAHARGQGFVITLQRGESVQYKTTLAQTLTEYDLTGTMIHANYPIAVIGASQRTYIPSTFDRFNYIANMIPPIRSWDSLYYSLPFYQPAGIMGHDASSFTVIGTKANQSIYRADDDGDHLFALLDHAYDNSAQPDIEKPSKWHSDAPFLLVQYVNSPNYPEPLNGVLGSPAMMIVPPVGGFGHSATVQLPIYNGAFATQFSMFINVIASANAATLTLDGTSIKNWTKFSVDSVTVLYRSPVGSLSAGAHILQSDQPVGAYAYGYSVHTGESIGYPAVSGLLAVRTADTTPPAIAWTLSAPCGRAAISDSVSGLSYFVVDSARNFNFTTDTSFIPGDSLASSFLNACLLDTSKNGYFRFTVYDMAGNRSVGELSYQAPIETKLKPGFTIASTGFDTVRVGTSKTLGAVTLRDTSSFWPVTFDSLWTDNSAFADTAAADKFPFTLQPNTSQTLQITFTPTQLITYQALLHAHTTSAGTQTATLRGSGYTTNESVSAESPGAALLLSVSPNPAKHLLVLNYALRAPATVSFDLFSIVGDPVYHWSGGMQSAGAHNQTVDFGRIAEGSYLYRFEAHANDRSSSNDRSSAGEVQSGKLAIEP